MKLKAGTVITCPSCEIPQLVSTKDIKGGHQLKDAGWESLGYDLTAQFMNCWKCSAFWARRHPKDGQPQIHTKDFAWISTQTKGPNDNLN